MKNLLSMVDFVFEQQKNHLSLRDFNITNYANFLKQPLKLWMFVPCKLVDGVWVVLEEPEQGKYKHIPNSKMFEDKVKEYQEAKDRCLFEGFKTVVRNDVNLILHSGFCLIDYNLGHFGFYDKSKPIKTIEDLVKYNLELTPNGQKLSGL